MIPFNFQNSYLELDNRLFSIINKPSQVTPKLLVLNNELAKDYNIDIASLSSQDGLQTLSGQNPSHTKYAQAYSGHQYGHFTTLGDGRALMLGEHIVDHQRFDIHLKGSGRTPYSRNGDGKATTKAMLREYIMSEAMHYLHVPTTRSLAVLKTNETIMRLSPKDGAILVRTAKSHIRVGTFEYVRSLNDLTILKEFTDYTINRHYPELNNAKNKYAKFLKKVLYKHARLIAKWQSIGFIHGVMNTDNVLVSGESIDYGPCAFIDIFKQDAVFSSIDAHGRYSYKNQAYITSWNIMKLAEALLPLLDKDQTTAISTANDILTSFEDIYQEFYLSIMSKKLGIVNPTKEDHQLINELLQLLETYELDFTNTFVMLSSNYQNLFAYNGFNPFLTKWEKRISKYDETMVKTTMQKHNPVIIPRNLVLEDALSKASKGDMDEFNSLLHLLKDPYNYDATIPKKYTTPNITTNFVTYCGT